MHRMALTVLGMFLAVIASGWADENISVPLEMSNPEENYSSIDDISCSSVFYDTSSLEVLIPVHYRILAFSSEEYSWLVLETIWGEEGNGLFYPQIKGTYDLNQDKIVGELLAETLCGQSISFRKWVTAHCILVECCNNCYQLDISDLGATVTSRKLNDCPEP